MGLVYKLRLAEEALPALVNAMQRESKLEIRSEIDAPGFYLESGKIVGYRIEHPKPSPSELKTCAGVLDELISRSKHPHILGTLLRWGVVSPFGYILKLLEGERWLPWPYLYGWTETAKTTDGIIILAIWRKQKDKRIHDIGFSSADNVPRFGKAISYDTYPVLINEVNLGDDRLRQLSEAMKHAIPSLTARARLSTKSTAEYISALSPCILTSNSAPPADPALLRRLKPLYYPPDNQPSKDEIEDYNKFLAINIVHVGILGDFIANYVLNNPYVLMHTDWKNSSKDFLCEFYKHAGRDEAPAWIHAFVETDHVQEAAEEQEQIIRGFLEKAVNDSYSKYYRTLRAFEDIKDDQLQDNNTFRERLLFCMREELISFLRLTPDTGKVLILRDIMSEMSGRKIHFIPDFTELARILQCEVAVHRMGDKTCRAISISLERLVNFVIPSLK